ncbi:uncharacterized protein LOC127356798 [Dicentrarchus labrax]|uniref:uncharacterized protein LOC127356798 n=1 Tax=Dicentrarchus labrax TaxID=13489 RepID=UPI0021F645C5|nr:uncharacterized protein LOC127356798 [Dicentrarchus labrax]
MDLLDLGEVGSGCEDENCGLASAFPENCSNQACQWEEPVFGLIELVCVTVIYIPLMLFGLLGNILTILVVWLRPHMRSSTYLYLSSMAVSDLLILLLLPLDLYKLWRPRPWPLGDLACKLTMFLSECCTFCTILHITFLSLERYLAVCWPITAKTLVTRRRTRALIGCLWLGAAVSAAPVLVMVGAEDVGGEELGLGGWREGGGWTGREGEQGGFMIGGKERGSGHMALMDGALEGINWEEKEKNGWDERVWSAEKGERKLGVGERDETKQGDEGGGEEEEGKMKVKGEQQNKMKEDEGGGREEGVASGQGGEIDNRECRCTHYAVSSGLLSAMMILSNLYFLIPLCILGLVYSLIGRTLWLRPQSSRRDQSHRHTVKMLGVIVLAFVLCWLPFHVGRTIFSLSLGTGSDRQEAYTDTNSHLDINTLSDVSIDRNINIHNRQSDSDKTSSKTGNMTAHTYAERDGMFCDICAKTKVKINTHTDADTQLADTETHTDMGTQSDAMSTDKHLYSHIVSHTRGQHINTGTSTHNLDPSTETGTHTELSHSNTSFHTDTHTNRSSWTSISINSQNNTHNSTPPTADTDTYRIYNNTHTDTPFNNTYTHPDTHYFLYYLSQYFNLVSSVLFYLSAAVNPLLYNLMSARYRHAVHSLIHTHSHTPSHRLRTLTARHSTTTL